MRFHSGNLSSKEDLKLLQRFESRWLEQNKDLTAKLKIATEALEWVSSQIKGNYTVDELLDMPLFSILAVTCDKALTQIEGKQ